jgi:hypothetical protein
LVIDKSLEGASLIPHYRADNDCQDDQDDRHNINHLHFDVWCYVRFVRGQWTSNLGPSSFVPVLFAQPTTDGAGIDTQQLCSTYAIVVGVLQYRADYRIPNFLHCCAHREGHRKGRIDLQGLTSFERVQGTEPAADLFATAAARTAANAEARAWGNISSAYTSDLLSAILRPFRPSNFTGKPNTRLGIRHLGGQAGVSMKPGYILDKLSVEWL